MRVLHDLKMITQEQDKKRTPRSLEPIFEKPNNTTLSRHSLFRNMIGQSNYVFFFHFTVSFGGTDDKPCLIKLTNTYENNFQGHVKNALYTVWTIIYGKPISV